MKFLIDFFAAKLSDCTRKSYLEATTRLSRFFHTTPDGLFAFSVNNGIANLDCRGLSRDAEAPGSRAWATMRKHSLINMVRKVLLNSRQEVCVVRYGRCGQNLFYRWGVFKLEPPNYREEEPVTFATSRKCSHFLDASASEWY